MSLQQLHNVLEKATSQNPAEREPAEKILSEWERTPGFHASLQDIYLNSSFDHRIRLLSVIQLKNGINKYWRRTATNCLSEDEKSYIRSKQFERLDEPMRQLAVQQATVTAKIVRNDFPNNWPNAIDLILPMVQSSFSDPTQFTFSFQRNALYTLHQMMKALSTKTLVASRRIFHQITPTILTFVISVTSRNLDAFFSMLTTGFSGSPQDIEQADQRLTITRIALKCIRRLVVRGVENIDTNESIVQFLLHQLAYLERFLELRQSLPSDAKSLNATISAICVLYGKLYLDLTSERIIPFILMPHSEKVVETYWNFVRTVPRESFHADPTVELILTQALRIVKWVVKNPNLHVVSSEDDPRVIAAKSRHNSVFLNPDFVKTLTETLIMKLLCLSVDDQELWEDDPESFVLNEETDMWEHHLRQCAERLFSDLASKKPDIVCPMIMSALGSHIVSDHKDARDAILASFGLAANNLYDFANFNSLFTNQLAPLILNGTDTDKVYKRRVAWLIGKWIGIQTSLETRPLVYQLILTLMGQNEDIVVRLTAAISLQKVVDDFDFSPEQLQPCLDAAVTLLMRILESVDEFDSKMKILNCLIVIIDRMQHNILPMARPITVIIPELWKRSEGQNLFRASIVSILTRLTNVGRDLRVEALKADSIGLYEMTLPIIRQSIDTSTPGHLYLLEEGLDLWLHVVQNAPEMTPSLLQLVEYAIHFLEYGTEDLQRVLRIIESYAILNVSQLFAHVGVTFCQKLSVLLGDLKPIAATSITRVIDTFLRAACISQTYANIFSCILHGGLFEKFVGMVIANTEMPNILVLEISVLARMIICDPQSFSNALKALLPSPELSLKFWENLTGKFDAMGRFGQRKLMAMAISSVIQTLDAPVLPALSHMFTILTSVELELSSQENEWVTALVFDETESAAEEGTPEYDRYQRLRQSDPCHSCQSLGPMLKTNFGILQGIHGLYLSQVINASVPHEIQSQIEQMMAR